MIQLEVWLYGPITHCASLSGETSHAQLHPVVSAGTTVQDLVDELGVPREERGMVFVNGKLAALPGLDPDREVVLSNGDRVGIFHRLTMWPMQYRFGAATTDQLQEAFRDRPDRGIHHAYTQPDEDAE